MSGTFIVGTAISGTVILGTALSGTAVLGTLSNLQVSRVVGGELNYFTELEAREQVRNTGYNRVTSRR